MWLVRRSKYEAERRARVRADMVVEHQAEEICALETGRSNLFYKIRELQEKLVAKDEPPRRELLCPISVNT